MRNLMISTAAAAALAFAAPAAMAGGNTGISFTSKVDLGVGGNAGISAGVEGGSYALGKNGSDAFAKSSNLVIGGGISVVDIGQSWNLGGVASEGYSVAKTSGKGAKAEAFETRELSFDNFTRFNADYWSKKKLSFGGFGSY
jgi:hypothetical protein